ncbi:hypothetical protein F511_14720 [Dorcoceras hygrometricum]|uniref:Uncharacterized protein n=1 Tax=Dorcoceras hygrometricum TaxID=472368 RepID=A0A2Z7ACC3_9LAMI|nr:hypothetical protein F511_14720 [Dorcoceras hygrometricum]
MVVDLIVIYVLKGPYCTLTTTNWFLQALSVIPRGSWGDVARRFTMIRWGHASTGFTNPARKLSSMFDRNCDEAMLVRLKRMFIWTWARPRPIGLVKAHHWSTYARPRATQTILDTHPSLHSSRLPISSSPIPRPPPHAPRAAAPFYRTCSDRRA